MTTLTITHTAAEGTLINGTARGDGTAEVLKANRWRWGRSIGAWFIPRSRDLPPKWHVINATAQALRAAGWTVQVEVDASPRDQAAAEEQRAGRAQARAERLQARSDKHARARDAANDRAEAISDRIPFGQPILVGHHSERRARRDAERIHRSMDQAVAEDRLAREDQQAARTAAAATDRRTNPWMVARRVEQLATDQRRLQRRGASDHLEHCTAQLDYWRSVRAQQIAEGLVAVYTRADLRRGDYVQLGGPRGSWEVVERVNATTVTLHTEPGWNTARAAYHQISAVRRDGTSVSPGDTTQD